MPTIEETFFRSTTAGSAILVFDTSNREILNILPNIFPGHENELAEWIREKTKLPYAEIWNNGFFQKMLYANGVDAEAKANTGYNKRLSPTARRKMIGTQLEERKSLGLVVTIDILAELNNVSTKTIQRDLKVMKVNLIEYK